MVEESKPLLEYAVSNSLFPVVPIGVIRKSSSIASIYIILVIK